MNALDCVADIVQLAKRHRGQIQVAEGWPHEVSISLVGTQPHPVTGRSTETELQILLDAVLHRSDREPPSVRDVLTLEFAREETCNGSRITWGSSSRLSEEEIATSAGGRLLLAVGSETAVTSQDLSYVGSGGTPTDGGWIIRLGVYGRIEW